jgi:O-antigen/teichoic acid export membrane protein
VTLAGLYVAFRSLTDYSRSVLRANEDFVADGISGVIEKILVVLFGSIFVFSKPTIESVLLGMSIGMLLAFAVTLRWVARKYATVVTSSITWTYLRSTLPMSVPLGLASIFTLIYFRTDSFMIDAMSTSLATGQYAIGFRILEALIIVPAVVVTVLLPSLSKAFERRKDGFANMTVSWIIGVGILAVLISITISLGAETIVRLIDDSVDALPAVGILRILIWSFPLAAVNYILSTAFVASNRQISLAWALGIAALSNVVLNAILIPYHGPQGAAAATIVTQALVFVILFGVTATNRNRISVKF